MKINPPQKSCPCFIDKIAFKVHSNKQNFNLEINNVLFQIIV